MLGLVLAVSIVAWTYQIYLGLGVTGLRTPQYWALYITSFVFWIGIGHAGTLISAILYLFRARWRTSVYRAAEAMTVFAVMTAGLFPILHLDACGSSISCSRIRTSGTSGPTSAHR